MRFVNRPKHFTIYFEGSLKGEAEFCRAAVESFYGIPTKAIKKGMKRVFHYNPKIKGYEVLDDHGLLKINIRDCLILTRRDIFLPKSRSREDDWIFACSWSKPKVIFLSVARLRGTDDEPSTKLRIPKKLYEGRLFFHIVHEPGHFPTPPKYYRPYVWTNPETGYETDLGEHCLDLRCAMSEVVSVNDIDRFLKRRHRGWLCGRCARFYKRELKV